MRTVTPTQLGIVGLFSIAALSAAAIGLSGAAQAVNPSGNNGTIKVDNAVFDNDPNNEPHVDCTFQIDWYGYDQGDYYSDVVFEAIPPTTRPDTKDQVLKTDHVFIGGDDASGAATADGLDASVTYKLDFTGIEPQGQQGYHVKLSITAPKSNGAETKFKVFWVDPCETPTPSTSTTTSPSSTTSTTPSSTTTTTTTTTPPLTTPPTTSSTTTSTTTAPPTPCESESDDDDCGVVTTPPALAG